VHRIYGPSTEQAWTDLWQARALPPSPAHRYWRRLHDRLDLFHRQRPFLQCPALSTVKPSTAAKLVPYRSVGNNVTLFDHTTAADKPTLSADEAARWLVTLHAFDPGGMKTPYEKDKSSERAPCNLFGVVIVEGANLKETLLLNTLLYDPDYEKPAPISTEDRPAWEDPSPPSPLPGKRSSLGWTDLLTWPSRRVLLVGDRDGVDGVVITPGERLDANLPEEEMMAAFWRPLTPRGTPKKDAPLLPLRLYPVRGVWRHSVDLLMIDVREENRTRRRPRTLSHLADLAEYGHIPADAVYTLRVLGQQLDDKGAVMQAWQEDQVPAPVALLRARNDSIATLIGNAITLADNAGSALRSLQNGFRKDRSASAASSIDLAYWPALPAPFATFLTDLGAAYQQRRSEAPLIEDWARQVRQHAQRVADRWATDAARDATGLLILGRHLDLFQTRLTDAVRIFRAQANQNTITREPDVHPVRG
jgi:CRISPR system Cascade subunit CasA